MPFRQAGTILGGAGCVRGAGSAPEPRPEKSGVRAATFPTGEAGSVSLSLLSGKSSNPGRPVIGGGFILREQGGRERRSW